MAGAVSAGKQCFHHVLNLRPSPAAHRCGRRQRCTATVILSRRHVSAIDGLKLEGAGERGAH